MMTFRQAAKAKTYFFVKLQAFVWQTASAVWLCPLGVSFVFLINVSCSLIEKKGARLEGDGVSQHMLADGQVELRMKISGLTSNLWITAEVFNHSTQTLRFQNADLIQFENPECFEVREQVQNAAVPVPPQQFNVFRYSYFWKGRRKSDPLYQTCLEKPMRFTLSGIEFSRENLKVPTWTIQP